MDSGKFHYGGLEIQGSLKRGCVGTTIGALMGRGGGGEKGCYSHPMYFLRRARVQSILCRYGMNSLSWFMIRHSTGFP